MPSPLKTPQNALKTPPSEASEGLPRPSQSPVDMALWEASDGRHFRWRRQAAQGLPQPLPQPLMLFQRQQWLNPARQWYGQPLLLSLKPFVERSSEADVASPAAVLQSAGRGAILAARRERKSFVAITHRYVFRCF